MKICIDLKKIKSLNPCKDRLDNYLNYYSNFKGDILHFLALDNITPKDKIWVSLRLVPIIVLQEFAFDMAIDAATYAAASDAADAAASDAAAAAAYAAYVADATAADAAASDAAAAAAYAADATAGNKQLEKAIDTLAYLISTHKETN